MAKRKLKPEEEAELKTLADRLLLTISFIENVQDFPSAPAERELIETARQRGDLRSLRLMLPDTQEMVSTLEPHEREGLEAMLQERLGVDSDTEREIARRQVSQAIKRGTIASEKERRRLERYLEALQASRGDAHEISALKRLLKGP
jgi:hypothetical protein